MTKDEQEMKRAGETKKATIVDRVTTRALMATADANISASILGNIAANAIRPFSPAFADTMHFIAEIQLATARASLDRLRHREFVQAPTEAGSKVVEVKIDGGHFDKEDK